MYGQLFVVVLMTVGTGTCIAQDLGDGTHYRLNVVEDVWLETRSTNYNNRKWLIVGKHPEWPKKRSLVKFQNVPSACKRVNRATMYLYYDYSSKPTWMSVTKAPFITRTIQAHRVLKYWKETEATTRKRYSVFSWHREYLGLDDTDANDYPTGEVTIYFGRPKGFVGIEVTSAVKDWKVGKPNYGLLIWATNEDQDGRDTRFFSKSHSDSSKHPYIALDCD